MLLILSKTVKNVKALSALVLAISLVTVSSCGGGGAAMPLPNTNPPQQIASQPLPGTADLNGTLLQGGGERVLSQAGLGLPGVMVTLINTLTGQQAGTAITDNLGEFEFKGVPAGDSYLVKLEFTSTQDLDGDGVADQIELYIPVSLADQAVMELLQQIGVADSDGDGELDALELEFSLSDDSGNTESHHLQNRRRDGRTIEDSNGNGSFDDDQGFDDSNGDGLADDPNPGSDDSGDSVDDNGGSGSNDGSGDSVDDISGSGSDDGSDNSADDNSGSGSDDGSDDSVDDNGGSGSDDGSDDSVDDNGGSGPDDGSDDSVDDNGGSGSDDGSDDSVDDNSGSGSDDGSSDDGSTDESEDGN